MPTRLNPYLHFDGDAREALEHYRAVFGGELVLSTYGDFGMPGPDAEKIMHGQLETPSGYTLMGGDTPPGMELRRGNHLTISLSGDEPDRLRGYFTQLSEGGQVSVPLEKQMWGDEFGQCTDRYGVEWLVNISQPQG